MHWIGGIPRVKVMSQIFSSSAVSIVNAWSTFLVVRVAAGSNSKRHATPSGTNGLCSTPLRDDEDLTRIESDDLVAQVNLHAVVDDEKHLSRELADDLGNPGLGKRAQFLFDVCFFHEWLFRDETSVVSGVDAKVSGHYV